MPSRGADDQLVELRHGSDIDEALTHSTDHFGDAECIAVLDSVDALVPRPPSRATDLGCSFQVVGRTVASLTHDIRISLATSHIRAQRGGLDRLRLGLPSRKPGCPYVRDVPDWNSGPDQALCLARRRECSMEG